MANRAFKQNSSLTKYIDDLLAKYANSLDKEVQLSQKGRAMLRVIEYFAKLLKVAAGH